MSSEPQRRGCLAALFGGSKAPVVSGPAVAAPLSYRVRADFLSVTELSFLRAAQLATGTRFAIMTKVNLNDLFFSPTRDPGSRNRINQKHVDFLFCDPQTLKPLLGIELDDSSHQRSERVERDALVDAVFASAGLPLLHLPARASYASADIATSVDSVLAAAPNRLGETASSNASVTMCPNCGVPMVVRQARQGVNAGRDFYGCINYPRCREMKPVTTSQ
jgi:hypothetical protein